MLNDAKYQADQVREKKLFSPFVRQYFWHSAFSSRANSRQYIYKKKCIYKNRVRCFVSPPHLSLFKQIKITEVQTFATLTMRAIHNKLAINICCHEYTYTIGKRQSETFAHIKSNQLNWQDFNLIRTQIRIHEERERERYTHVLKDINSIR